jgi:osmotically inducible lipoprotein OsmB
MGRIKRALSRARYAGIGGAVGGALGGLVSRNAASTGAAMGALVGATYGERRLDVGVVVEQVKERGEKASDRVT